MKAIKYALLGLIGVIGMLVSMFGPVRIPFVETVAKNYYRYALGGLLVILLLITTVLGLFILAFDANNFKSEIIQFVKDRTQRDLLLEGDIKVTFFPKLGLNSGKMTLTQRNSAKVFTSINNVRLYIAWWPLVKRQLVIDHVVIDGIHANVVRLKDGSTNFDDLLASDEHLAPLMFDIDSLRITDSSISLQDELTSQRVKLHELQLETGRLADTAPSNLIANFSFDSEKTHISVKVKLKSRLYIDRKAGRYELADLEGKLEGNAGRFDHLLLDFGGSLDIYPAQGLFTTEDLVVSSTGKYGQHDLSLKLAVPDLKFSNDVLSGSQLALDASLSLPNELFSMTLQLPDFQFANRIFSVPKLSADFDFKSGGRTLRGRFTSPFSVNLEADAPKLQFPAYSLTVAGIHPVLSGEVTAGVTGNLQLDYAAQNAQLAFDATIDDSAVVGKVAVNDFDHPVYAVDINAKRIDLDRYLSSEWTRNFQDETTTFDTAGITDILLQANLHADEIGMAGVKLRKLVANISIGQSMIAISPLTAQLYGGSLSGNVSVATQETPVISVRQKLKGFQMNEMLSDTSFANRLTGKGNIDLDLSAQGSNIGSLRKALKGSVSVDLVNGSLSGINLRRALVHGKYQLGIPGAALIYPANFSDKTGFSELKAMFNIRDGKISSTDFEIQSPMILTAGDGNFDLDSGNLSYRLNTTVSSAINRRNAGELLELKGVTVPISVSGPSTTPNIAIDFAAASGGNVASLVAAHSAKAVAASESAASSYSSVSAASVPGQRKKKDSGLSVTSKAKKPAGDPVKKSQQ